jgi:7,8-dihydropterin-6-yl-methyl-4-(beta-D-ribofuranosyl)aminobenzene 5'-phosphate synthase
MARYANGAARADRSWPGQVEAGLRDIGEVGEVSILPLVERLTRDGSGLAGEPGVSYLIQAGRARVPFDSGLSGGKARSALVRNAEKLGVDLGGLDAVVISHLHADHVGGFRAMRQHTFTFSRKPLSPAGCRRTCPPRCSTRAPMSSRSPAPR